MRGRRDIVRRVGESSLSRPRGHCVCDPGGGVHGRVRVVFKPSARQHAVRSDCHRRMPCDVEHVRQIPAAIAAIGSDASVWCADSVFDRVQDSDVGTALHYAAMNDLYDVATRLLVDDRLELNSQDNYGNTRLWWASRMGSYRVRNLLLTQSGIHPNPLGMNPDSGRVTTAFQNLAKSKNSLAVHLIQNEDGFG